MSMKKTWSIILKVIIAVAGAIAGVVGFNFEAGVQLMQVDNNWSIRFGLIPVVLYFNCDGFLLFLRLGRQTENS